MVKKQTAKKSSAKVPARKTSPRKSAPARSSRRAKTEVASERDSTFFLKIIVYMLLASIWIGFKDPITVGSVIIKGFPIGVVAALLLAMHDKFQIDRKLEYVIILIFGVLSVFLPTGAML